MKRTLEMLEKTELVFQEPQKRCRKKTRLPITKSYVILCTKDMMIVPIKADLNPYNNRSWFSGGTPQFFGGSPQGDQLQTMQQEVREESRGTLQLSDISGLVFQALPNDEDQNTYNFYYSTSWQSTGTEWNNNVTTPAEGEMQRLINVPRGAFDPQQDNNWDIIDILLVQTGAKEAVGLRQFLESHTATAFTTFIRTIWFGL